MRISDWSSDVCSSDLQERRRRGSGPGIEVQQRRRLELTGGVEAAAGGVPAQRLGLGQPGQVVDGRLARHRVGPGFVARSEEHTSELQSLMRISYAVFCLKKKKIYKHSTKHEFQHHTNKT